MDKKNDNKKQSAVCAEENYPGVARDYDGIQGDAKNVKDDVKELNNNPRNNEIDS